MSSTAAAGPNPALLTTAGKPPRDYRLDFFRGLALFFIFVDHIPNNVASWVTVRNFGLSDATEIFIFISGYSAMLAYGISMERKGFLFASAQVLRRCWQIYIAHVFLVTLFIGHVIYVGQRYNNPMFADEMGLSAFVAEPHTALMQALLLKFKPVNLDVLPLYVVLLAIFPAILWSLKHRPVITLAGSAAFYAFANYFNVNLPGYPKGVWFFNPFAWQFLFVIGTFLCRVRDFRPSERLPVGPSAAFVAVYQLFSLFLVA
ncbi:MAG: OpgC domain-containing protein [Alphaproteobacteria bacterium]|nr:OpgC domain-containing protein [Alphaproteobacteria bacterium]